MVQLITQGIKVSIVTRFEGAYYEDIKTQYAFSYTITIENQSEHTVQLASRYWEIRDSLNAVEVVEGDGVIGVQPTLKSGEKHTYSSGCLLQSPFGSMQGYYRMINFSTNSLFKVAIPNFKLNAPFAVN
ncbi:Co2+/Mg2+ efflux protein ApaG [Cochleicola gelatinilyticus]|uniref:Co2+/Mg2+ efflux protein ApaG n=1 Tax=Cochleicola gelatinilyticus TaxID=1763537 RepID=A0A167F2U4_9FLAO|nr:Co2+/Mg2+ efflux protein ApaG [Cochleicola gelatinilyticus]OAB76132.1 Co2+/Mg2+ efflux protein ApaG [Cochleicola gelatinilyticus]